MRQDSVSFDVQDDERDLIEKIVERAHKQENFAQCDTLSLQMDITACHANGCPLKLQELLDAPDFDFFHDVAGINRHIDRETGKLLRCFLPRFAQPKPDNYDGP